jgi:hypothetical protein
MEIVGASLLRAAEIFLHAGYVSAYPRPFRPYTFPDTEPSVQIDVAEALRLEGETLTADAGGPVVEAGSAAVSSGPPEALTAVLAAAGCFFAMLVLVYLAHDRLKLRRAPALAGTALFGGAVLLSILLLVVLVGRPRLPETPPWQGVEIQEYADPAQATQVLLHGIIADGIVNVGRPIRNLANIAREVGLPLRRPSRGMSYALKTYGLDGWGRPFRLTRQGNTYLVASAGADGEFGGDDDVEFAVRQSSNDRWEGGRHGFFVRRVGGENLIFFHRWNGSHFRYRHGEYARTLTGSRLFDVLVEQDVRVLDDWVVGTVAARAYDIASCEANHDPLVLLAYAPAEG